MQLLILSPATLSNVPRCRPSIAALLPAAGPTCVCDVDATTEVQMREALWVSGHHRGQQPVGDEALQTWEQRTRVWGRGDNAAV